MTQEETTNLIKLFERKLNQIELRIAELVSTLPELPRLQGDETYDELLLEEYGYSRFTKLEDDGEGWHAYTDGWDDMTECGMFEYVDHDGLYWRTPEDLPYD